MLTDFDGNVTFENLGGVLVATASSLGGGLFRFGIACAHSFKPTVSYTDGHE